MKICLILILMILALSCSTKSTDAKVSQKNPSNSVTRKLTLSEDVVATSKDSILQFIPKNYVLFKKIEADLNKDDIKDCILIIKETNPENIILDEYRGHLDKNRRGIVILFGEKNKYRLAAKNYNCFSSENEDGGVYFAPELTINSEDRKLIIHYGHGRYGFWKYIFRYNRSKFELVGYDDSVNHGPTVINTTSINFLTHTKLVRTNVNENPETTKEVFIDSTFKLIRRPLLNLEDVEDFDELQVGEFLN